MNASIRNRLARLEAGKTPIFITERDIPFTPDDVLLALIGRELSIDASALGDDELRAIAAMPLTGN